MICLNLISPKQQQLLKIRRIYFYLENLFNLLIIISVLIAIILIPINDRIKDIKTQVELKRQAVTQSNQLLTDKINNLNDKIEALNTIQSSFNDWPLFLTEFSNFVPENIVIIQLNAQLKTNQFNVQGYANTREDYLIFKNNC